MLTLEQILLVESRHLALGRDPQDGLCPDHPNGRHPIYGMSINPTPREEAAGQASEEPAKED